MRRKKVKQLNEDFKEIKLAIDDTRIQMIQMLIPLGLEAINDLLQQEVAELVGERYQHSDSPLKRWGANSGSAYLGDQKVQISVPRVRDTQNGREIPLKGYEQLKGPAVINNSVLANLINGISCRKYERVAQQVPETFGIKKSAISEKFIQASAKKLKAFLERDLSKEDVVAIFMDGKTFAENEIVVAMGVRMNGDRIVLGCVETDPSLFLRSLN
jgi:transposase-like protein